MGITFNAIPSNVVASGVFIETSYKKKGVSAPIPQRIALLAQHNAANVNTAYVPKAVDSVDVVAFYAGRGSMAHRMAMKLFKNIGQSTIIVDWFPLPAGVGTATWTLTATGTATGAGVLALYISGDYVPVSIASGSNASAVASAMESAINAKLDLPVTASALAGVVTLTAKNVGLCSNDIVVKQNHYQRESLTSPTGVTLAIVANNGGTSNPSIQEAFDKFGDTFYTFVAQPFYDDASLDVVEANGDARENPLVKRPFAGIVGYNGTKANYETWLESRNSRWTAPLLIEGSPNHPYEIASAIIGQCAVSAQVDPSRPFKTLPLYGILDGNATPLTYAQRNALELLGGSSTFVDAGGNVRIYDLVTTYTTNELGAVDESGRWVSTITNTQAKIYSLDQVLLSEPFTRGKIVDDNAITSQTYAIRPKTVKAYLTKLVDELWIAEAWSKNRNEIVNGIEVHINATNPSRLDVVIPDDQTTGLRIIAVAYQWTV